MGGNVACRQSVGRLGWAKILFIRAGVVLLVPYLGLLWPREAVGFRATLWPHHDKMTKQTYLVIGFVMAETLAQQGF